MHDTPFVIYCVHGKMTPKPRAGRLRVDSRDVGIPVVGDVFCSMSHDAVCFSNQFHHESMSYFIRALQGLRMAAPRKVAIIGSGNW